MIGKLQSFADEDVRLQNPIGGIQDDVLICRAIGGLPLPPICKSPNIPATAYLSLRRTNCLNIYERASSSLAPLTSSHRLADNPSMSTTQDRTDWRLFSPGAPGYSARMTGIKRGMVWYLPIVVIGLASFAASIFWRKWPARAGAGWTVAIIILYYLALKWLGNRTMQAVDPWAKGASGELLVGNALSQLESRQFRVFHDLSYGRGNIDHVVVGRCGVFVIETKACGGQVHYTKNRLCLNGRSFDKDPLRQVKGQAAYLSDMIEDMTGRRMFVEPILCFTKAWVDEHSLEVENVRLTRPRFLTSIVTGPVKYSSREVEDMAAAVSSGVRARPPQPAPRRAPAHPKPRSSSVRL